MKIRPSQLTLNELRKNGYLCQVVERYNSFAHFRVDLFGIIDIVAIKDNEILGIQATSAVNHTTRVIKARKSDTLSKWLKAGGKFQVWSWAKKNNKWEVRKEELC